MTSREQAYSTRATERIAGALFITATVASVVGFQLVLSPILNGSDFFARVSENGNLVILGVLIDAINSAAVVAISVLLFPILRRKNEALATAYVGTRVIESAVLIIGHISLLALVTMSREYAAAASSDASYLMAIGTMLVAVSNWTFLVGPGIVFGLTALILNRLLYQSKLVPRFLSVWGLVAATLLIAADFLAIFGVIGDTSTVFVALFFPIALQEMVFAVWLIVRGFSTE